MNNNKKFIRGLGGLLICLMVMLLSTCEKVPDYCSRGERYDPDFQFCFAGLAYPLCNGRDYNPLLQGCDTDRNEVGTRCVDNAVVPLGTPCAGYTLTTGTAPENGGSTDHASTAVYSTGTSVNVTATAATGYTFTGWSGASTSTSSTATVTMDNSKTLVAMFTPIVYTLTVNTSPTTGGAVFINGTALMGAAPQNAGTQVEALAQPADGYVFTNWSGAATGTANPAIINITGSNQTLTANFQRGEGGTIPTPTTYVLTVNRSPSGIGTVTPASSYRHAANTPINISATAPSGYRFVNWMVTGGGTVTNTNSANTTVTLTADATVTANFQPSGSDEIMYCIWGGGAHCLPIINPLDINVENAITNSQNCYQFGEPVPNCDNWIPPSEIMYCHWGDGIFCNPFAPFGPHTESGFTFLQACQMWATITPREICVHDGSGGSVIEGEILMYGGQRYSTVIIGGRTWMAENLNYETSGSWCYDNNASNCVTFGRLYTWNAAMTACPANWRLPTRQDWDDLNSIVGSNVAGRALKSSRDWDGIDIFGFSALPGGGRNTGGSFSLVGSIGYWWSATERRVGDAWLQRMYWELEIMYEGIGHKDFGFSVRCVKDD